MVKKLENKQNELSKLAQELERQMKNRYDVVVSTDRLCALKDENDNIKMDVAFYDTDSNLVHKTHGLTDWAHIQISDKCGIPMRYYRRMMDEGQIDLLSHNINTWIPSKEKRMVRVLDNKVRALLSDGYQPIDNHDVLFTALEEIKKLREQSGMFVDVKSAKVTDRRMYLKFTSPDLSDEIIKFRKGNTEPVQGGVVISNSEVGCGAFSVQPFINVLVCQNGLISQRILRRVHIGKKKEIGVINWSDKTRELESELLLNQVRDMIQQTFDKQVFHSWVDEINGIAQVEVPKPEIAIDNVISHFKLPKSKKDSLLSEFTGNAPNTGNTQWGVAMAVTRLAQEEESYDERINLEEIGAKILSKEITPVLLKDQD